MADIQAAAPGLATWLRRVFWVMGGYMFTSGLLTAYIALTSFRIGDRGAILVVAIAGPASIGWMMAVNFLINSDFKWLLLAFALPWPLALYWLKR
jgi:hypothetical protein